jgi:hypothetical protein
MAMTMTVTTELGWLAAHEVTRDHKGMHVLCSVHAWARGLGQTFTLPEGQARRLGMGVLQWNRIRSTEYKDSNMCSKGSAVLGLKGQEKMPWLMRKHDQSVDLEARGFRQRHSDTEEMPWVAGRGSSAIIMIMAVTTDGRERSPWTVNYAFSRLGAPCVAKFVPGTWKG